MSVEGEGALVVILLLCFLIIGLVVNPLSVISVVVTLLMLFVILAILALVGL